MHTISLIYKDYTDNVKDPISKTQFIDICNIFNMSIIDYILDGNIFNMKNNLSTLSVIRKERDPRIPVINWGESNKYKEELINEGKSLYNKETGKGTKWHIYYTDGEYLKYYWRKSKCTIKNKSVYRFDATRGIKGNKGKLMSLLKEDELAYLKFKKD